MGWLLRLFFAIFVNSLLICQSHAQDRQKIDADSNTPVLFKADQLRNEEKLGLIVATGNVEFTQGKRILLADTVTYNQREDLMTANGNVSLLEPTGEVLFADRVSLTGDMRNGIMENLRIRLTNDAKIAAASGRRTGGVLTEINRAVYSPCNLCEDDKTKPPIWQVKAYAVKHDKKTQDIVYNDAFIEFFGVPVVYTPYLSHADPTIDRREGFLTPKYGSSSDLGMIISLPYYVDFSSTMDATFTPIITTDKGIVGAVELRQRLAQTDYIVDSSITYGQADSDNDKKIRGHVRGKLRHDSDSTWRAGGNLYLSSDDTYLRRYQFGSETTLENRAFIEGFRGRNYATGQAYYFQGLRTADAQGNIPIVLPQLDYSYVSEPKSNGSQRKLDANFTILTRTSNTSVVRLSTKSKWERPYVTTSGNIFRAYAALQTDGYWVNDTHEKDAPENNISGITGRIFPQLGLDWRLPLAHNTKNYTQTFEPIVNVIIAPEAHNHELIPNEDSLSFEFDDTNILSENRFSGLDRVEGGPRVAYGIQSGVYGTGKGFSSFFVGQSYRLMKTTDFGTETGLNEHFSDIVGRLRINPSPKLSTVYRFSIDRKRLNPRRNELKTIAQTSLGILELNYLSVDQQNSADIVNKEDKFGDREEITLGFSSQIASLWKLGIDTRRDLTSGGGTLRHGAFLQYKDECFEFSTNYSRSFTRDRDVKPTTAIMFRVALKTLGEIQTSAGIN